MSTYDPKSAVERYHEWIAKRPGSPDGPPLGYLIHFDPNKTQLAIDIHAFWQTNNRLPSLQELTGIVVTGGNISEGGKYCFAPTAPQAEQRPHPGKYEQLKTYEDAVEYVQKAKNLPFGEAAILTDLLAWFHKHNRFSPKVKPVEKSAEQLAVEKAVATLKPYLDRSQELIDRLSTRDIHFSNGTDIDGGKRKLLNRIQAELTQFRRERISELQNLRWSDPSRPPMTLEEKGEWLLDKMAAQIKKSLDLSPFGRGF